MTSDEDFVLDRADARGGHVVIASPCSGPRGQVRTPDRACWSQDLVEGAAPHPRFAFRSGRFGQTAMPDPIVLPRLSRVRGSTARSTTWWGRAFVRSFEELTLEADHLGSARSLARSGRLGAIVVLEAMASAVLDPGTENPLMAQVKVERLDAEAWTTFAREAARESGHAAALEAGELPADLVEHADEAGVELIPGPGDIDTACECDAWLQPCRARPRPALPARLAGRPRSLRADAAARSHPRSPARRGRRAGQRRTRLPGAAEREEVRVRAAQVLALAQDAPSGHGLADAAVAAYDEAVSRLL